MTAMRRGLRPNGVVAVGRLPLDALCDVVLSLGQILRGGRLLDLLDIPVQWEPRAPRGWPPQMGLGQVGQRPPDGQVLRLQPNVNGGVQAQFGAFVDLDALARPRRKVGEVTK